MLKNERETMEIDKIINKEKTDKIINKENIIIRNGKENIKVNLKEYLTTEEKKDVKMDETFMNEYDKLYQLALLESRAKVEELRTIYNNKDGYSRRGHNR